MNALVTASVEQTFYDDGWDPYNILGIRRRATIAQIRAAYRRRAKSLHSDAGGNAAAFLQLKEAHDFLLNTVARALWDRKQVRATEQESKKARALLHQICGSVVTNIASGGRIPPEHANIPDLMRQVICAQLDEFAQTQNESRKKLGRLKLMKGKTRRRGRGDNVVARVIDTSIAGLELALEALTQEIRVADIMLAELEVYDFDPPAEPSSSKSTSQHTPSFTIRLW